MTSPLPTARRSARGAAILLAVLLAVSIGACAAPAAAVTYPGNAPIAATDHLYVSIGDSYGAGYQPSPGGPGATTTNGFAYQVANRSATTATPLKLVNFACSGVTSTQIVHENGCTRGAEGPGAPGYGSQTQLEAATRFIAAHRSQIALVTVIVGGNDVKPCLLTDQNRIRGDVMQCVTTATATLRTNLATMLQSVRAAVGPGVPIVGLTYPDIYLGAWVTPNPDARAIATGSVVLFRSILNPALAAEYAKAGAAFVDVTAESGAYDPLTTTTIQPPYGAIPQPVAKVCTLTFYCELGDVHPRSIGYSFMADEVIRVLPAG